MLKKMFYWSIILFCVFCVSKVKALDINDFSFEQKLKNIGSRGASLEFNVYGDFESGSYYYVKFVNDKSEKPTDIPSDRDSVDTSKSDIAEWKGISKYLDGQSGYININDDWYLLDGYDYAYLLKCDLTSCEVTDEPAKIDRPALPKFGQRYEFVFSEGKRTSISMAPVFPHIGENGDHEISVKIGMIKDNELLYSIYKQQSGSLEKLMDYAKNDDGFVLTLPESEWGGVNEFSGFDVVNGAYYYIYINYDNASGMYRDLSDISIAMAESGYITNYVEWNFDEKDDTISPAPTTPTIPVTTTQKQIKNPKTNDMNNNLVLAILIGSISLAAIAKKRIKKLSK